MQPLPHAAGAKKEIFFINASTFRGSLHGLTQLEEEKESGGGGLPFYGPFFQRKIMIF